MGVNDLGIWFTWRSKLAMWGKKAIVAPSDVKINQTRKAKLRATFERLTLAGD